jgi:type II secretory pathway component HofQ
MAGDLDTAGAVSLSIADPIPIRDALRLLVRGTPFSIVLGDGVEGTFSGELKDLALRQALDAMLGPRSLDFTLSGRLITVHARRPVMQIFDVSYLNVRREWRRHVAGTAPVSNQAVVAELSAWAGTSYYDEIERGIVSLLSPEGRAHVDRRSGIVQVVDFEDRLHRMGTYLDTVHVRAMRQVRLSARVVEVTLSNPSQGLDWAALAARAGGPAAARDGAAGVPADDFGRVLSALAAQGTVRTLASPRVQAMNNEPALMRVSTHDVQFRTETADGDSEDPADPADTPLHAFSMTITPHIDASGMVQLSVSPSFTGATGDGRPLGAAGPVVTAETDTVVRVRDGESIVLAGLQAGRSELVILLNATIVNPGPLASTGGR